MCGRVRVLVGTLLACLAVAGCGQVETVPTALPRVTAPPGDADRPAGPTTSSGTGEVDVEDRTDDRQRPQGWPDRIVVGFQGASGATAAHQALAALIEERLHVDVAIVSLRDLEPDDAGERLAGFDVVVADAMTAHAAGFDGLLHTVQDAVTGQMTAWVTLAPDVWCTGGTVDVAGIGRCVETGDPVAETEERAPTAGLERFADRLDGREVVVPASSSTAVRLAMLQFERELGAVPGGLVVSGPREPTHDALWLVPVEQGPHGVAIAGSWGPSGDGDPVVVGWGPWVPHAVVAVGPEVVADLADAIDETLRSLSNRMEAAAVLVDLAGVEGFATIDDRLWDVLGDPLPEQVSEEGTGG